MRKRRPGELKVVIVGDGVHGSVHALRASKKYGASKVRVIGPNSSPLAAFRQLCSNSGMEGTMRSPYTHHIDLKPSSLRKFAKKSGRSGEIQSGNLVNRPGVDLFFDHCTHVWERNELDRVHLQDHVVSIRRGSHGKGYRIKTLDGGSLKAANVIVATGGTGMRNVPEWARIQQELKRPVYHLLDPILNLRELLRAFPASPYTTIGIVGGGMTGVQSAIRLADKGFKVVLFSRRDLQVNEFDADKRYFDPAVLKKFRQKSVGKRVRTVHAAENPGSITRDVESQFQRAIEGAPFHHIRDGVIGARWDKHYDEFDLHLESGQEQSVDVLLLATGYSQNMFQSPLIEECMRTFNLFDRRWGNYPRLRSDCSWRKGLYISGPAAAPIVGPFAPNIQGAHLAASRIYG